MKNQLILVISKRMTSNKKEDRHEDRLIRMGSKTRENLGLINDKTVELWPDTNTKERISRSKLLTIYQAFSSDLKDLRASGISDDEFNRSAFVTEKTFRYICSGKNKKAKNIWLADSIEETVIGGDPEFILRDPSNKHIKYAKQVSNLGSIGELSSDGPLAEIRPDPTGNIDDFIKSIRKILNKNPKTKYISKYDWLVDPYFYSPAGEYGDTRAWTTGGHIHIGTPAHLENSDLMPEDKFSHLAYPGFFPFLNKALDEYIAIPMMKVAGKDPSIKRRSTDYGYFGELRTDYDRLEYRTLSSVWLAHPELARSVLGASKAVIDAFFKILEAGNYKREMLKTRKEDHKRLFESGYNGWKDVKALKEIQATRSSTQMKNILEKGEISYNKQYFNRLRGMFKSLSTYKKYAKYIDTFLAIVSLPNEKLKNIDTNIKHSWIDGSKFII